MIIAKVKRTRSATLPAGHERSSVFTVESVIRQETLGRLGTRQPPCGAVFAVKFARHAAILPHIQTRAPMPLGGLLRGPDSASASIRWALRFTASFTSPKARTRISLPLRTLLG